MSPIGSFTDPEYAQVGLTEAKAREAHNVVVAAIRFDSTTRTIIDGRTTGFCKLIVDRATRGVLGCHIVGERAVEIAQVVSIVMAARMRVTSLPGFHSHFPPTRESLDVLPQTPHASSIWMWTGAQTKLKSDPYIRIARILSAPEARTYAYRASNYQCVGQTLVNRFSRFYREENEDTIVHRKHPTP